MEDSSEKKAGTGAFGRVGVCFVLTLSLMSSGDFEALLFFLLSRMRFGDRESFSSFILLGAEFSILS
jgi:hypothetical protein